MKTKSQGRDPKENVSNGMSKLLLAADSHVEMKRNGNRYLQIYSVYRNLLQSNPDMAFEESISALTEVGIITGNRTRLELQSIWELYSFKGARHCSPQNDQSHG